VKVILTFHWQYCRCFVFLMPHFLCFLSPESLGHSIVDRCTSMFFLQNLLDIPLLIGVLQRAVESAVASALGSIH